MALLHISKWCSHLKGQIMDWCDDEEVVLTALGQSGSALVHASERLRTDNVMMIRKAVMKTWMPHFLPAPESWILQDDISPISGIDDMIFEAKRKGQESRSCVWYFKLDEYKFQIITCARFKHSDHVVLIDSTEILEGRTLCSTTSPIKIMDGNYTISASRESALEVVRWKTSTAKLMNQIRHFNQTTAQLLNGTPESEIRLETDISISIVLQIVLSSGEKLPSFVCLQDAYEIQYGTKRPLSSMFLCKSCGLEKHRKQFHRNEFHKQCIHLAFSWKKQH
jgi:hypothetical protein